MACSASWSRGKKLAVYFEVATKPNLHEYYPTKVGGAVKRINAYARVLLNDKHVKSE